MFVLIFGQRWQSLNARLGRVAEHRLVANTCLSLFTALELSQEANVVGEQVANVRDLVAYHAKPLDP